MIGGMIICLADFSRQLECVYTSDGTGALRFNDSTTVDLEKAPIANGRVVLDSLAMCSMNGYYLVLAIGLTLFTILLVFLGGSVMFRGRSLMMRDGAPMSDRLKMRKSLTIFYCIIATTVVLYIISSIIYVASYIVSKPIERAYLASKVVVNPELDDARVSVVTWYLFTIWLPQCVPPLLLLFLHYDQKRSDPRSRSRHGSENRMTHHEPLRDGAGSSSPPALLHDKRGLHSDDDENDRILSPHDIDGQMGNFEQYQSHKHRHQHHHHGRMHPPATDANHIRMSTFLDDPSNRLHMIVKLKIPSQALRAAVMASGHSSSDNCRESSSSSSSFSSSLSSSLNFFITLEYCTLHEIPSHHHHPPNGHQTTAASSSSSSSSPKHHNDPRVLLPTLTKDAVWKSVAKTERVQALACLDESLLGHTTHTMRGSKQMYHPPQRQPSSSMASPAPPPPSSSSSFSHVPFVAVLSVPVIGLAANTLLRFLLHAEKTTTMMESRSPNAQGRKKSQQDKMPLLVVSEPSSDNDDDDDVHDPDSMNDPSAKKIEGGNSGDRPHRLPQHEVACEQPLMEFMTTPQAVMDAASHGQSLSVRAAEAHDVTCKRLRYDQDASSVTSTVRRRQSSASASASSNNLMQVVSTHMGQTELQVTTVMAEGNNAMLDEPMHQQLGNIIRYFQYETEAGKGGLVVEELKESKYSNHIPRQLLELIAVERTRDVEVARADLIHFNQLHEKPLHGNHSSHASHSGASGTDYHGGGGGFYNQILQSIQDDGDATLVRVWLEERLQKRKEYLSKIRKNIQFLVQRDNQKRYFKASVEKKTEDLKFLPINLHVEDLLVGPMKAFVNEEKLRNYSSEVSVYDFTTVGAMAAHCYKFKHGGLLSLQAKLAKKLEQEPYRSASATTTMTNHSVWSPEKRGIDDLQWDIQLRRDVCFSQALTALVASFVRKVELALSPSYVKQGREILRQLSKVGFLFQCESLLSTHGNEIGMLEDMSATVDSLACVTFRLVDARSRPTGRFSFVKKRASTLRSSVAEDRAGAMDVGTESTVVVKVQLEEKQITSARSSPPPLSSSSLSSSRKQKNSQRQVIVPVKYIVTLHVQSDSMDLPERLASGGEITVTPVLFTQGINEMQTIANNTERAKTELQDQINLRSLKPLEKYCDLYCRHILKHAQGSRRQHRKGHMQQGGGDSLLSSSSMMMAALRPSQSVVSSSGILRQLSEEDIKSQLSSLRMVIEDAAASLVKTKRPEILTKSSDLCRWINGGRVTICKSAKDRTAMSVTLEQVRILHRFHDLPAYKIASTVAVMRSHGVRIENALKNTGKRHFAFNKLQRYAMPEDYRCPEDTSGNNVS